MKFQIADCELQISLVCLVSLVYLVFLLTK